MAGAHVLDVESTLGGEIFESGKQWLLAEKKKVVLYEGRGEVK